MASENVFLTHPAFERKEVRCKADDKVGIDSAGYRPIHAMVLAFRKAGVQLQAFRAADFDGDMTVNPLHVMHVDRVDLDEAVQAAIIRGKKAREELQLARKRALDKQAQMRDAYIDELIAKRRQRDGLPKESAQAPDIPPSGD